MRRKTGGKGSGVSEWDYQKAREQCIRANSICAICGTPVQKDLPSLCVRIPTDGYTVENAHEIPMDCGQDCRKLRHRRKANPWGPSADHIIPVSQLELGDKRLVDPKFLRLTHNLCNLRRQAGENDKPEGPPLLKEWY